LTFTQYKPIEKIKQLSTKQLEGVYNIVKSFKKVLSNKKSEDLDKWIVEAQELKINEVNSFIKGINK
jgi:transposase